MCLRPFQFHIYKNVKGMEEISSVVVDVFMRRAFRSVPYVNKIIAASLKKLYPQSMDIKIMDAT